MSVNSPAMPRRSPRPLGTRKKILFSTVTIVAALAVVYAGSVVVRTRSMFESARGGRGWTSGLFEDDDRLGFKHVSSSRGAEHLSHDESIPVRFDEHGFRIPASDATSVPEQRPLVLALGCSFTYGACCRAEEAFPFLVARELGGRSANAGVSSYGLAQMVLQARALLPRWKPDYVLVQYSPWLIDRAQSGFAPTSYGKLPTPYFHEVSAERLELHPPVFRSIVDALPAADYRASRGGFGDFLSFQFRVGLPLLIHDDLHMLVHRAKRPFGAYPPAASADRIVAEGYGEIAALCEEHGSRMIVVALGGDASPIRIPAEISSLPTVVVADAHRALRARLPAPGEPAYARSYYHWRGRPPRLVDSHPNPVAHAVIASTIVETIRAARAVPEAERGE